MSITLISPKSWPLNAYTNSTWTDLVAGTAAGETVKAINIANNGSVAVNVSVRVASSGGVSQAVILPLTTIAPGVPQQLNIDALNLTVSQKLQIFCDLSGVEFYASGVTYA